MTDDTYMKDFMAVYQGLERWGPGSESDTQKALLALPNSPGNILEIGCGNGLATSVLVKQTEALVTAVDTEQSALNSLVQRLSLLGMEDRVQTHRCNMDALAFPSRSFDLIWAEGSAYVMGVENALREWKVLLSDGGFLVFTDMVWLTESPSDEAFVFWKKEYPDIQTVTTRLRTIANAGYHVVEHFDLSNIGWNNYYAPLAKRVNDLAPVLSHSQAWQDIKREIDVSSQYSNEFGYHFFILAKR